MSRGVLQPMKSSELAQSAKPVFCFVCMATNTRGAEYCCRCRAPMALAYQAAGQATQPKMVAVLGPSGSGKTVYLGMLMDMLSRQPQRLEIIARGASSIGLQQTTVSALARCEFPAKTSIEPEFWNWLHCEIYRNQRADAEDSPSFAEVLSRVVPQKLRATVANKDPGVELVIPDMAGETILHEVEHPQTSPVVHALLQNSAASLLLIDASELGRGERDPDFAAMKILSCLKELELQNGGDRTSRRPVALILTKAERVEGCRENPLEFARLHAPGTWQYCQRELSDHAFFAASVVGCCAWLETRREGRRRTPLRIEPHGIIEPFEWLLDKMRPQGKR
jgi:energy-coupling factor transporter ATP-binding protein EcfA2